MLSDFLVDVCGEDVLPWLREAAAAVCVSGTARAVRWLWTRVKERKRFRRSIAESQLGSDLVGTHFRQRSGSNSSSLFRDDCSSSSDVGPQRSLVCGALG